MVIASNTAAVVFTATWQIVTDNTLNIMPNAKAESGCIKPDAVGLVIVRIIRLSISRSYHIFKHPAAPAPTAMHKIAVNPKTGWICPGAIHKPQNPVKITKLITRGFNSSQKLRTEGLMSVVWIITL